MSREWSKLSVKGKGDYVLCEKLKRLKGSLKVWNKEVYGWLDLKIVEAIYEQHDLDKFLVANMGADNSKVIEARRKEADVI